jgi:hypothetical protein
LENASSPLTLNPFIVYSTLALYGVLFAAMFLYIHGRFRAAARVLSILKADWASAHSTHTGLIETARDRLARLPDPTPEPVRNAAATVARPVTPDIRTQVIAMGKRGLGIGEISRSTGLPEGEVDVLLGMARMQR